MKKLNIILLILTYLSISNKYTVLKTLFSLTLIILTYSSSCFSATLSPDSAAFTKARIIICSDISNEPDDQQSLVHFLLYANEFDIEGLIAGTSCWKQSDPDTATIFKVIKSYEAVLPNLLLHSNDYPSADYLRSITKMGVTEFAMKAAEEQLDNEGINHIISVIDKDDPRPVWILSWGGSNTLGGAVMKVRNTRSEQEAEAFVSKIRGYEIAIQDDGHAYIAHHYPNAKLISSELQWKGMSKTTPTFGAWSESWGGNNEIFTHEWIEENIQTNHGELGSDYLSAVYLWEGDSPSFLYLINNGLSSPENQNYGSWGGRFDSNKKLNIKTGTGNGEVDPKLKVFEDYWLYSDAKDTWTYNDETYKNNLYAPVFRWREAYMYDFQSRMDWCVMSFEEANHPPVPVFNGEFIQSVATDSLVSLSAIDSSDPDGDELTYHWFYYKEAGNYNRDIIINNPTSAEASFTVPAVYIPTNIHIILELTDKGEPNLSRYKRIMVNILQSPAPPKPNSPTGLKVISQSSDRAELAWEDNSENEEGFKIERKDLPNGEFILIDSVEWDITNFTDSSLSSSSTYIYRIAAFNYGGYSEYSNEFGATTSDNNEEPWLFAAYDGENINFEGTQEIRFGANGNFITQIVTTSIGCNQTDFNGDPAPGVEKHCDIRQIEETSINDAQLQNNYNSLKTYPNPLNNDVLTIDFGEIRSGQLTFFDLNGKELFNKKILNQTSISIQNINLNPGLYTVKFISDNHVISSILCVE